MSVLINDAGNNMTISSGVWNGTEKITILKNSQLQMKPKPVDRATEYTRENVYIYMYICIIYMCVGDMRELLLSRESFVSS